MCAKRSQLTWPSFYLLGNGYFGHYCLQYYRTPKTPSLRSSFLLPVFLSYYKEPIVFTSSVNYKETFYPLACVTMERTANEQ